MGPPWAVAMVLLLVRGVPGGTEVPVASEAASCGGMAPFTVICETGPFQPDGDLAFYIAPPPVGRLELVVAEEDDVILRCVASWIPEDVECEGKLPRDPDDELWMRCKALPLRKVPVGPAGPWGCWAAW